MDQVISGLNPKLEKIKRKCQKYAFNNKREKFEKLITKKYARLLTNLELADRHEVTITQALKDAAREKLVFNEEPYHGGWEELNRLKADLLQCCTRLVDLPDSTITLSAAGLHDELLIKASRTRNGADAYFAAKVTKF